MIKKMIKKMWKKIRVARARKKNIAISCPTQWYGNNYGGFYVCPQMLSRFAKNSAERMIVYSCGIGDDISFDRAIMQDYNCEIFAFDPTPKSISFVEGQDISAAFKFYPYGISSKNGQETLYLSNIKNSINASVALHKRASLEDSMLVQMRTLQDIAREHGHSYVDILKMDIEGSEFAVIESFSDDVVFGQICIEFHARFFANGKTLMKNALGVLKKHGYHCFAIADSGIEYSFVNINELEKR